MDELCKPFLASQFRFRMYKKGSSFLMSTILLREHCKSPTQRYLGSQSGRESNPFHTKQCCNAVPHTPNASVALQHPRGKDGKDPTTRALIKKGP